jgi:hypothetical protein
MSLTGLASRRAAAFPAKVSHCLAQAPHGLARPPLVVLCRAGSAARGHAYADARAVTLVRRFSARRSSSLSPPQTPAS